MSHSDTIKELPTNGVLLASTHDVENAAYKIDEVDDPLYVLARDADGVEPINAEVQGKIDNDELRL